LGLGEAALPASGAPGDLPALGSLIGAGRGIGTRQRRQRRSRDPMTGWPLRSSQRPSRPSAQARKASTSISVFAGFVMPQPTIGAAIGETNAGKASALRARKNILMVFRLKIDVLVAGHPKAIVST
jgi:hypothetical protein